MRVACSMGVLSNTNEKEVTLYTIEVEDHELATVEAALGRTVKARRKAVRKAAEPAPLPEIATGDEGLDAWIADQWASKGHKPYIHRKPKATTFKVKRLTIRQFEAEEAAWKDIANGEGNRWGYGTPEQNARALADIVQRAALMQTVSA